VYPGYYYVAGTPLTLTLKDKNPNPTNKGNDPRQLRAQRERERERENGGLKGRWRRRIDRGVGSHLLLLGIGSELWRRGMAGKTSAPAAAHDAVLRTSATGEDHGERVSGYDFNHGLDLQALLRSMYTTGFQASHLGQAVEEVNRMVSKWNGNPIFKTARTLGASEFSSEEFRATNQPFGLRHCEERM
jgi:hypothetical protein